MSSGVQPWFIPDPRWLSDCERTSVPGTDGLQAPVLHRAAVFDLATRLVGQSAGSRPSGEAVVAALDELGRRLADPASGLRARVDGPLAAVTGLSPQNVAAGLERCAAQLAREQTEQLLALELGDPAVLDEFTDITGPTGTTIQRLARAPELLVEILPGNVFAAGVTALARGLLLRCPLVLKLAAAEPVLVPACCAELQAIDPAVTRAVAALWWKGGDTIVEEPFFAAAEVVVVHGDDATVADVRRRLFEPARLVAYGPRVSAVLVTREALRGPVTPLADAIARDVALYEQRGCLSACVVAAETGGTTAPEALAGELAAALERAATAMPGGRIAEATVAAVLRERKMLALSEGSRLWTPDGPEWTVAFAPAPVAVEAPGARFVVVRPVADLREIWTSPVDDWTASLQAVALAAEPPREAAIAAEAAAYGVARICRPGELQAPLLAWPQDGRPALGDLVSWTWWER